MSTPWSSPRFSSVFLSASLFAVFGVSPAWAQTSPAPSAAAPAPAIAAPVRDEPVTTEPTPAPAAPDAPVVAAADPSAAPAATVTAPTPAAAAPTPEPVAATASASPEVTAAPSATEAAAKGEAGGWMFDHFFDHIKVRGYTQFRYNAPTTNSALVNLQGDKSMGGPGSFSIRRARLVLSGDVHPLVSIYLQFDFASTTDSGLHFAQVRDWYADIYEPSKEFRIRVGQSKVPFGFENMQSSQNRITLDRSDAINSALVNERDLGAFLYYAPTEIRKRFKYLVESGLKGSGDYGMVALGVFNGQTANKADLNANKHVVGRVTYPFEIGNQIVEVGGGGYVGRYVVSKDEGIDGDDEFWDARGNLALILYPKPFGFQAEYNVGVGPELQNVTETTSPTGSVFSGTVQQEFLQGGYVLAQYRIENVFPGIVSPYVRGFFYDGGKKHETNAPHYKVKELEFGVEWQIIPALEFTGAFTTAERTAGALPYQQESGQLGRFQLQVNY